MNRQQRRKIQREIDQSKKTLDNLSPNQMKVMDHITNAKVEEKISEIQYIMDRCISALLIELFPEKDWDDIEEIETRLTEFIFEDTVKWKKLIEGKDFDMSKKYIKEIELKVEIKAKDLIAKEVKQKEAIEILLTQFPELSKAMVTNAYKKVKAEVNKEKDAVIKNCDDQTKEALKYIFKEDGQAVEANKVAANNVTTENKEEKCMSKLKVKSMVVEGENGVYKVCENGVELQGEDLISFSSMDELEKYRKEELEKFENRVSEFREVFKMIG